MKEAEKNIKQLIEILNKHSYNYYALDNPTISDKEYDKLYDNLVSLEKETNIIFPYSPTRRIGDEVLGEFSKYTHKGKLWSLDKAQTYEELENWLNKNKKFISDYNNNNDDKLPELQYVLTKKFDGLTINLSYDEEGILTRGTTRGTGFIGENVTNQTKTIKSIPLKIENGFFMEVHGEAVMTKEAFIKYNEEAKVPLKNLRNGAAGALRNLNIQETAKRNLSAYFYDVGYTEGKTFESYVEMMEFIKKMGLPVDKYMEVCTELHEIEKQIEYINEIRQDLNYDIDGVVIAIDDIRTREAMGYTVKFPKWALAFKFEAEEATTKLLEVEWNVGRSGRISPTAILEPVDIGGATVKRATLNNMDDINRKNVKINSNVFIRRSNDVIPEIMGVSEDSKDEIEIIPPKVCPYCLSPLVQDGVHLFCENSLSCKPQLVKSIVHYASREAMNIEGFSEKTAEQLFDKLNMKSIADLYRLKKEDLLNLDKFKEKKTDKLLKAIENSKNCKLPSFLFALSIPNVGIKTARDIVSKFKTLDRIISATSEELVEVSDVGDIVAYSVMEFFKDENILNTIKEILDLGVIPSYEEEQVVENPFLNKSVVVTGSLKNFSRIEIKEKLIELGAKAASSVSKKTDYILVGEEPGSKYEKGKALGITILTEEDFQKMIKS